ncbi:MAG: ATP-binding protein [Deltaproteobacteria bacterium]|jgi:anti-sigma regulatory factor (Ser/Thr protein kinase)|nr:ATP-binding protein [Deltaproteobacteria bacterium]
MKATIVKADLSQLQETLAFLVEDLPKEFQNLSLKLELALEELIVNIWRYAYGPKGGEVKLSRRMVSFDGEPHLVIGVSDWGKPFNPFYPDTAPDLTSPIEERRVGGLGIHLIRSIADHYCYWHYRRTNNIKIYFRQKS